MRIFVGVSRLGASNDSGLVEGGNFHRLLLAIHRVPEKTNHFDFRQVVGLMGCVHKNSNRATLSQGPPRDAPNIWVP